MIDRNAIVALLISFALGGLLAAIAVPVVEIWRLSPWIVVPIAGGISGVIGYRTGYNREEAK